MKTLPHLTLVSFAAVLTVFFTLTCIGAQAQVDVWTWHNDNWRDGQNTSESTLTPSNVNSSNFGQMCSYPVDGQVFSQPLVLAGSLTILGHSYTSVVYMVTQNDSVYLFSGTPPVGGGTCTLIASAVTGTSTSLIPSTETAVSCSTIGDDMCDTISPSVGILGTPVIDEKSNHIYLVTYSQSTTTFYHRVHALYTGLVGGTTPLTEDSGYGSPQIISSGSTFTPVFSSANHIQRPGLLLLPSTETEDPELYIAFSMMDGTNTFPPGFVFRYTGDNLSASPLVYSTQSTVDDAGGGIWMDGAGLAAGVDSSGGNDYLYIATADGNFSSTSGSTEPCTDCGNSFVKLGVTLGVNNSFTPYDQACRWTPPGSGTNPDADFGSGGVMLVPDALLSSWPYVAVVADKNIPPTYPDGYIYVIPRGSPGFYNGTNSCTGTNNIVETMTGTGLYHNTPAFWSAGSSSGYVYLASVGGAISQYPFQSTCTSGTAPLCNAANTALDPSGRTLLFPAGVTPAVSANGIQDGILWAYNGASIEGTTPGSLYAFNATNLNHLYNSNICTQDVINSVTAFAVPTVANGYVYIGAQSNNTTNVGQGTFYIFGEISNKTCTPNN